MDEETFFEELYSHFYVSFPCFALVRPRERGFVAESAADGTISLVVLTDDDLLKRYRTARGVKASRVTLPNPAALARLVKNLPKAITHVTFDPSAHVHRRYPVEVIRDSLASSAR